MLGVSPMLQDCLPHGAEAPDIYIDITVEPLLKDSPN